MVRINNPEKIEQESFNIIDKQLAGLGDIPSVQGDIIKRVIHATGDFQYQELLRFHHQVLEAARKAIAQQQDIITDVNMVRVGINKAKLKQVGCKIKCYIAHPDIITQANQSGITRATLAIRKAAREGDGAIVVIGNAPTALWETLEQVTAGQWRPSIIVGVPVGFVGAAEAKERLLLSPIPYITCLGNKGGSAVAVAIMNALLNAYAGRD